jgi:multidrug resistance efflux pump
MFRILFATIIASTLFAQEVKTSRSFLVKAVPVKSGNIQEYIYAYGRVTGLEEAAVVPAMPGRVVEILKSEGDKVKKDEVIALLDREIPGVKTEYLQIVSPIDGVLTYIGGKVGQIALQTQPFAYIVSEQQAVELSLSSEDLKKVRIGARAYAIDADNVVEGRVISRSFGLDPMSLTGKVRVSLSRNVLQIGSVVRTKIVVREKAGV